MTEFAHLRWRGSRFGLPTSCLIVQYAYLRMIHDTLYQWCRYDQLQDFQIIGRLPLTHKRTFWSSTWVLWLIVIALLSIDLSTLSNSVKLKPEGPFARPCKMSAQFILCLSCHGKLHKPGSNICSNLGSSGKTNSKTLYSSSGTRFDAKRELAKEKLHCLCSSQNFSSEDHNVQQSWNVYAWLLPSSVTSRCLMASGNVLDPQLSRRSTQSTAKADPPPSTFGMRLPYKRRRILSQSLWEKLNQMLKCKVTHTGLSFKALK